MRFKFAAVALVAVAGSLAACGGSSEPNVARTVDVSALTFADVQQRALAAATKPGVILHLTDTEDCGTIFDEMSDVWLDLERHVARKEKDGRIEKMFGPDKLASMNPFDGRYEEAQYSYDGIDEPLLGFTLEYLRRLILSENEGIDEAVVDGAPAVVVRVRQETNHDGVHRTEKATIYLDEAFLPLKMDEGARLPCRSVHVFRTEYVARDAVPADFFSFEQVRAAAKTSADLLREAAKPFGRTYWFGEPFEGMVVGGVSDDQQGSEPTMDFDYTPYRSVDNPTHGPDDPFPCARLSQHTRRGWDDLVERRRRNPILPERIERASLTVLGGEARIFEQPAGEFLPAPYPAGEPSPTPPALSDLSAWIALITFDDAVLELDMGCGGPPGKNPNQSLAGIRHLVDSLQVLEAE